MSAIKTYVPGLLVCLVVALPAWFLGSALPLVGGPVFAILIGMVVALFWKQQGKAAPGITYTSKKILQYAVVLLGFGLNLAEVARVGATSLPVIISTIATALIVAWLLAKALHMPSKISILIGVGSSICGGSAIAATAPVIKAKDEEIAQAISVIFLFNVLAALIFPTLGGALGLSNQGFGLFAGTAVNDTSSVTAAATTWDALHPGANTLDEATIVKLTRTLAIIPVTLALAVRGARKQEQALQEGSVSRQIGPDSARPAIPAAATAAPTTSARVNLRKIFPTFIIWFLLASLITTIALALGASAAIFAPLKTLSKFCIVLAMAAIGLNTNLGKLVRGGAKPILMGFCCWVAIAAVSLGMQALLGIW